MSGDSWKDALKHGVMTEVVHYGRWSLQISFGKGDEARDRMRALSEALGAAPAAGVTVTHEPCQHRWAHAPTVGYYQCIDCGERHEHGGSIYRQIEASFAHQPVAKEEIEQAVYGGMDKAADFCIRTLAKALDVDDWQQADGSETWDGDVAGTIYNVLKAARVYDDEDGRIARLQDVTGSDLDHDRGLVTPAEAAVIRALVSAWNLFLRLPPDHPEQQAEFRHGIHALQHMIFARPAIRWWNLTATPAAHESEAAHG